MQVCFACFHRNKSPTWDFYDKAFTYFTNKLVDWYEQGWGVLTTKNIQILRTYQVKANYGGNKLADLFHKEFV